MCWKDGGRLHKVGLNSTGQLPLNVAKTLHDENLLLRLNNVLNAVDTAKVCNLRIKMKGWLIGKTKGYY